jgi:hypothetical protein
MLCSIHFDKAPCQPEDILEIADPVEPMSLEIMADRMGRLLVDRREITQVAAAMLRLPGDPPKVVSRVMVNLSRAEVVAGLDYEEIIRTAADHAITLYQLETE